MARGNRKAAGQFLSLDSLVDIVSNNVGILIILAAFMALFALVSAERFEASRPEPREQPALHKLLVPWSHPTNRNTVFFSLREGRVQLFDLRRFYLDLLDDAPQGGSPEPVTVEQRGVRIRFFPVTNQVYCLEFTPREGAGESWFDAQQPGSTWQAALERYPAEKYVYFFWVTGDSFELFREVRSRLWDENYEVGWKPTLKDSPLEICNGFEGSTAFQPQ